MVELLLSDEKLIFVGSIICRSTARQEIHVQEAGGCVLDEVMKLRNLALLARATRHDT